MAIVWACQMTLDQYVAAGRQVEVPRPDCPDCQSAMSFRSGYHRNLRVADQADHRIWVRRGACRPCRKSHALLPSFCLLRRLDPVSVIGSVIEAVAIDRLGVRRAVLGLLVPHTTARDWVRRFNDRAPSLLAGLSAAAVELGDDSFSPAAARASLAAVAALRGAWRALVSRVGLRAPGLWAFATLVTGGKLIATATDPPSIFLGSRRLIPPAP